MSVKALDKGKTIPDGSKKYSQNMLEKWVEECREDLEEQCFQTVQRGFSMVTTPLTGGDLQTP